MTHPGPDKHSVLDIFALDPRGEDVFIAPAVPTAFDRTFGGQVVSQALAAAQATVEGKQVHSLHSYFLLGGDSAQPIDFRVTRLREGRSFAQRIAEGYQNGKRIFYLVASFHRDGDTGPFHEVAAPDVARPEELDPRSGAELLSPRMLTCDWADWDIRVAYDAGQAAGLHASLADWAEHTRPGSGDAGDVAHRAQLSHQGRAVWFRTTTAVPADRGLHRTILTYMTDMTLLYAATLAHPKAEVQMASLDHSVWFYRDVRADEWMLFVQNSPAAGDGRGLAQGQVFNADGQLVAVVVQEGLLRTLQ